MTAEYCAWCARLARLALVALDACDGQSPERLRIGERVICLRSREHGVVVSIDDHRGEALVAFRRSTVVSALCDFARPGDA